MSVKRITELFIALEAPKSHLFIYEIFKKYLLHNYFNKYISISIKRITEIPIASRALKMSHLVYGSYMEVMEEIFTS